MKEWPILLVVVLDFLSRDGATREIYGAFAFNLSRAENADEPVEANGEESTSAQERKGVYLWGRKEWEKDPPSFHPVFEWCWEPVIIQVQDVQFFLMLKKPNKLENE